MSTAAPSTTAPATVTLRSIRVRSGLTLARAAEIAGVSVGLVRLYEADPAAVKSADKRAALDRLFGNLRRFVNGASGALTNISAE